MRPKPDGGGRMHRSFYTADFAGATNHGARDRLLIGKRAGNPRKCTLIKFDLSGIPAGAELSDAKMRLQYYGRGGDPNATWIDRPVAAHKILVDWNELEATTTRRKIDITAQDVNQIDIPWSAAYGQSGTDYSAIAEDTQFITPDYPRWISWDITNLTQQWLDGAPLNYRVEAVEKASEKIDNFLKKSEPRMGKGKNKQEVKSNITDNESAKMTTSKGTIQGYNGVAAVDKKHQIIIDARIVCSSIPANPRNKQYIG